jgi:hypothetical protein
MPGSIDVKESGRCWATLELQSVSAVGRLQPRLQLYLSGRAAEHSRVVLKNVWLRLEHRKELVGEGRISMAEMGHNANGISFEVPTSQRLLRWVTDSLAPTSTWVQFDAALSGVATFWMDPSAPPGTIRQRFTNDPPEGEWRDFQVSSTSRQLLQVERTQWFEMVLKPTRTEDYRYLEIALPRSDAALAQDWAKAVENLDKAERAYASGDDAAAFLYLRGSLDALPGAKKAIVATIGNERKRDRLDAILTEAGKFLHEGRHVAMNGEQAGSFPVDHLDAAFALDLMRVLLSHFSLMLAAETQRDQR